MFRGSRLALVTRTFSTKSHAPPKKVIGTNGRYAGAVYTAASKIGALETVENELKAFNETLKKIPNFAAFLANPTVRRHDKYEMVGGLFEEGKVSHITRNLFLTLAANGKIGEASKVIAAYDDLLRESRGVVTATIVTAEPLKKKTFESIKGAVLGLVGAGKTVDLTVQVDEKILGGLQVLIGDKFLDLSVSSRIADLSATIE